MSARSIVRGILAAAAAGSLMFGGVAAVASAAPGNNGTLKVHEYGTPEGTESNDPKVCKPNFEGFGFDAGQTGYLMIEVQGGDKPTGENVGPIAWGPANSNGRYDTQYFNLKPGHYKATVYGKITPKGEGQDVKAKSKVFKVQCASEEPQKPQGTLNVSSTCESISFGASGVKPTGSEVMFKLDGTRQSAGTYPVPAGSHTVTLIVNGTVVDTKTVTVKECEKEGKPSATLDVQCEVVEGWATGDSLVNQYFNNLKVSKATDYTVITVIDGKASASTVTVPAKQDDTKQVAFSAANGKKVGIEIRVGDKVVAQLEFKTSGCKKDVPQTPVFKAKVTNNEGSCLVRVPQATVTIPGAASIGYKLVGSSTIVWQHREVPAGTYTVTLPKVAPGSSVSYRVVASPLDDSMKPFTSKKITFSVPADCDKPNTPEKPEKPHVPQTPVTPEKPHTPEKPEFQCPRGTTGSDLNHNGMVDKGECNTPVKHAPPPSEDEGGIAANSSSPFLPIGAALALIGYGIRTSLRRQHN